MLRITPLMVALLAAFLLAPVFGDEEPVGRWRSVNGHSTAEPRQMPEPTRPVSTEPGIVFPATPTASNPVVNNSSSGVRLASANFPADRGQVWREYDISQYAMRVSSTQKPEQAIVDWILRETGYEAWHNDTVSSLSATPRKLRVYHTPEVQAVVARVVDRFVGSQAESRAFGLRVISVNHPNWRAKAQNLLQPVKVQTPGVQAWVLRKEDAAVLMAELRRRSDYREHSSPYLMVHNGQPTMVNLMHPKTYIRDIIRRPDVWPGFQPEAGQIDEGLALEFCPLLSVDTQLIDATIKCTVTKVDKTIPVVIDMKTTAAANQRTKIEVPQMTHFRFHERFRWPTEQVLLISMGMVAEINPTTTTTLVNSLPLGIGGGTDRGDLLVMVESKPKENRPTSVQNAPIREAKTYRGRY